MSFVQLNSWELARQPGAASGPALGVSARRAASIAFTILVHLCLLWLLVNHLARGAEVGTSANEKRLTMFNVVPVGERDPDAGVQARVEQAAPAAVATSAVDLSAPADLPPEWSVSSIRVPRAPAPSGALAGAAAEGAGAGRGGAPGVKQFVGFGDGIGGELLLDKAMLEEARRAAMRGFPGAKGTALIFLRVSPTGTVMSAMVKGGSRDIGSALRRELVGKKLFLVQSAIGESALVALPPVNLGLAS